MELLEAIGAVKTSVDEVKRLALPRGEAEDRFKKIEEGLETALAEIKAETVRRTTSVAGGVEAHEKAASWLRNEEGIERAKDVVGIGIYLQDPMTGQIVQSLAVPEEVAKACEIADEVYIVDSLARRNSKWGSDYLAEKRSKGERDAFLGRFPKLGARWDRYAKALSTSGAGTGAEWIPNAFGTNLLDIIRLQTPVVNLIPHINMPDNPWNNPLLNGIGKAWRVVELANATASDLGTENRTWTAHKSVVFMEFSDEMSEDSIVAIAPTVRSAMIRAFAEGLDKAFVNGDNNAAGHFDFDYQNPAAPFETFQGGVNGLRQFALDNLGTGTPSTVDGGADFLSYVDIGAAISQMLKFAAARVISNEVVALVNTESFVKLLTEAGSPILTLDTYGARATILTGEVGRIFGVPILVSQGVEERRNAVTAADGHSTMAGPNTFSTAVVFNRMNFRIGDRRDFRIERDRDIVAGKDQVVGSARHAMQAIEGDVTDANWNPSGTPAVVAIRNIN